MLVDNDGVCKLADFGGSKQLIAENDADSHEFLGTINWSAPEII